MAIPHDSLQDDYFRAASTLAQNRVSRGPTVHVALFALTFLTTATAGALLRVEPVDLFFHPQLLVSGFSFAIAIMTILLSHELGHYFLARFHGVDASLPYFIPGIPLPLLPGTFGAFIRLRSPTPNRRALFDIGAAGPWAGFVVSVFAIVIGLQRSEVYPPSAETGVALGEPILFSLLVRLVLGVSLDDITLSLHGIAYAGWFGLFVTAFNLMPVGQLDGGHVAYAVFGRSHAWISRGVLLWLAVLGLTQWAGWLLLSGLVFALGADHPPTTDAVTPLDKRRRIAAALTLVVLLLSFMPAPFHGVDQTPPPPAFEGERVPIKFNPNVFSRPPLLAALEVQRGVR